MAARKPREKSRPAPPIVDRSGKRRIQHDTEAPSSKRKPHSTTPKREVAEEKKQRAEAPTEPPPRARGRNGNGKVKIPKASKPPHATVEIVVADLSRDPRRDEDDDDDDDDR